MPDLGDRWQVCIHRDAEKELRRAPRQTVQRIWDAIGFLAQTPHPTGAAKLRALKGLYRLRVGEWRVIYHVDYGGRTVTVLRIAHRSGVYRNL